MTEFTPHFSKQKTRRFQVKPAVLLRENTTSEYISRPVKLKILVIRKIVKILETGIVNFSNTEDIPKCLQNELFNAFEQRIRIKCRNSPTDRQNILRAWSLFFSGSKLELKEFLGCHWSHLVFEEIVSSQKVYEDVKQLVLQSNEVNSDRLCFLFELAECSWKPKIKTLFSKLPQLTSLTLHDFCDDDTISLVGLHCPHLVHLHVTLGPESFSEQQLSDDGFSDLIDAQLHRPTLREVNISDCNSSTVTAKTILGFSKLKSLEYFHVMASHFIWLELSIKFLGKEFTSNSTMKTLAIKFGYDNYEHEKFIARENIQRILDIFTNISELEVLNFSSMHQEIDAIEELKSLFSDKVRKATIKKCRDFSVIPEIFPNVRSVQVEVYMNPKLDANIRLENLLELKIKKQMFPLDFQLVHDLLLASTNLKKFKVHAVSLVNYNEENFINLFSTQQHLQKLEEFSLRLRSSCKITINFLLCLLQNCPNLDKIGNLLSWDVSVADMDQVARYGKVAMFASKYHWSLPWRCEDGQMVDVEHQTLSAGAVGDYFDNY